MTINGASHLQREHLVRFRALQLAEHLCAVHRIGNIHLDRAKLCIYLVAAAVAVVHVSHNAFEQNKTTECTSLR